MAQIFGFHHVTLPARDLDRSGDWYERVFGFQRILIEEDEDRVTMVLLEHPEGMLLCLRQPPDPSPAWQGPGSAVAVLGFRVASRADLVLWDTLLAELQNQQQTLTSSLQGLSLVLYGKYRSQ